MFPRVYCENSGHIITSAGGKMVNVAIICHFSINQPSACCVQLKLDFLACGESALEKAGRLGLFLTCEAGSTAHHGKSGLLVPSSLVFIYCSPRPLACCLHSGEAGHKMNRSSERRGSLEGKKKCSLGFLRKTLFTFLVGQLHS